MKIFSVICTQLYPCYKSCIISLFVLGGCWLTSCTLDDNSTDIQFTIVKVNDNIDTLTLWHKSTEYIIQKPDFTVNDTLIIQSGTIIKFNPDSASSFIISETGVVFAQGLKEHHIIFTSLFDNSHNLVNIRDLAAKKPNVGDWKSIIVNSNKKSVFNMCDFYFGGGDDFKSSVRLGPQSYAIITNCNFVNNDGGNIVSGQGVLDASEPTCKSVIQNNVFYSNSLPVGISTLSNLDSTNIFHNPKNLSAINKYNCIRVASSEPMNLKLVWTEDEVAYVISGPDFIISPDASLLIGNNVTIKFQLYSKMSIEGENSALRNYDGPGVVFTSINDDNYKGDSNGDGNSTIPQTGDWSISAKDTSTLEWSNFHYFSIYNGK